MSSHKIFCTEDDLEEILMFEDHSTIANIINQFCDVILNISNEEVLEKINDNPLLKALFKRENAGFYGNKDSFEKLINKEYSHFLNDILILDIEDNEIKNIRNRFGILALKLGDDFLINQNYHYGYSIDSSENSLKCWSELFKEKPLIPVNSAIIIDNFLWSNIASYKEENEDNIYPILNSIIPQSLEIPFHLMIVIQNKNNSLTRNKAKEIIKKMKKKIIRKNGVEISLITQTDVKTFHERVILTNYHYITSHKGFVAFANNRVKNETNGDRNWVFKDINDYVGEIRKHKHIGNAYKVFKLLKNNENNGTDVIFNEGNTKNAILSSFN